MNNNTPPSEDKLRVELAAARRRLIVWRCVALGVLGVAALGMTLAAAPDGHGAEHGAAMVQVSPTEIIDLSKLSRVSRSPIGQAKTSVTFFFATEGEKTNFAIFGADGDNAWSKLSERVGEKWASTPSK